jgi:TolB-like protein/Tfp pilus assembly protein PilF
VADPVQRRLAAILAADVAGYSRLMGEDEAGTRERFNALHDEAVRPAIEEHRGRLVKTMGDGFLVEFASVVDAVQCAADIQARAAARSADEVEDRRMALRIGVHLGDVIVEGEDIHGDGVNIAARIEGFASPGGICLSDMVHAGVRGKLALEFADMGEQAFKNIAEPVRVWSVRVPSADAGPAATSAVSERPSIAVLPFANLSGDPEQEYFADGMVEEIITGLARIRWLTVIARNSTFAYKGGAPDVRKVGRELGVRYVLEGSVRKAGERVRITAQMVEAETGGHLWADRFDGMLADVFELQDQITLGVVAAIEPSVLRAEIERTKRKRPDNLDAYDLYLRAMEQGWMFGPAERSSAIALLEKALALSPGYAEAHGLAAHFLMTTYQWGGRDPRHREKALAHAEAVARARTDDATTLAGAAFALSGLAGDHDTALHMLERALAQNPGSAMAHNVAAVVNCRVGRFEHGRAQAQEALRLSPFDPMQYFAHNALAAVHLAAGEVEDALANAHRSLESNPDFAPGLVMTVLCQVRLGRPDDARATLRRLLEVSPGTNVSTLRESLMFADSLGFEDVASDLRSAGLPED